MLCLDNLKKQFNNIDFSEIRPNIFKVLIPYFYPDGDMYDIFVEEIGSKIKISDYGLTLMKLSYSFDIETEHRKEILNDIIAQNKCFFDNGDIYLEVSPSQFEGGLYQFINTISKVSAMNIMSRSITQSEFYKLLKDFMFSTFSEFKIKADIYPTNDENLKIDYLIPAPRPIYLFGVIDNDKASKVIIGCMDLQKLNHYFRSLIVTLDLDRLSKYYRQKIVNTTDKQFTSLNDFKEQGIAYIKRELTSC